MPYLHSLPWGFVGMNSMNNRLEQIATCQRLCYGEIYTLHSEEPKVYCNACNRNVPVSLLCEQYYRRKGLPIVSKLLERKPEGTQRLLSKIYQKTPTPLQTIKSITYGYEEDCET